MLAIPEQLAVGADYGLATAVDAGAGARRFADFVLSPPAQQLLARHGFAAVRTP
jgi:ABC-type molybdate transport system substrate-binding protein